jgi:O-methyltransferase involved in polyketide biosynthesis
MTDNQQASETARKSRDAYGLGATPGQRGAEILAGLRAEYSPSPETKALTKFTGSLVARMLQGFLMNPAVLNYTLSRPMLVDQLVDRALPNPAGKVFVDIASGFAPRGWRMATKYPDLQVIEVDLPDVVAEKQKRLRGNRRIGIPTNLTFLTGDLGVIPLTTVMNGRKADVIVAEGLLGYLHFDPIQMFCKTVYDSLTVGGVFISDITLRAGVDAARDIARMFAQQAGNYYGTVPSVERGREFMTTAGFDPVEVYLPTEQVEAFNLKSPMLDIGFVQVAHKPQLNTTRTQA